MVRPAPRCCQQLCLALPAGSVSRIRHAVGTTEKKPQAVSRGAEPLTSPNGKLSLQRGCSLPPAWRGGPKHMEGKTHTHTHTNHAQLLKASRGSTENFSISVYVSIASFPFQRGLSLSPASGSSSVGMFAGRRAECYIKQTIKLCYTA